MLTLSGAAHMEAGLHMNAIAARLMAAAKKHELDEAKSKEGKTVNVTVNFGSGNTFTGPVAVGETIQQTFSMVGSVDNPGLREKLELLTKLATRLIELLPQDEDKVNTASVLKEVVEAANKKPTSASQIRIRGAGLIEAAKTVAEMSGPISTAVAAVVALFA